MPGESVPQGMWLPPRVATLLMAASDALDRSRAQADYLCDGIADQVQINQALNALPAAGGRVMLSEGTFNIVDPITIPANNITLRGQGRSTFIDGDGLATGEHGIVISGVIGCVVRNLRIQTQDGGGKVCHCIFIDNANNNIIEEVTIDASDSDGIHIENNSDNCIIRDNYIQTCDGYGINIAAATCDETVVQNNRLVGNATGQISDGGTDTILPEVVIDAPNPDANIGDFAAQSMLNDVDTEIRMKLHIPTGFQELVRAQIIIVPGASGNLRRSVDTDIGKICADEAYDTHSDLIAAGEVAVTLNELECLDIAAALDGIAASDWVGILLERFGSHANDTVEATVWLLGLRMQYV